MSFASMVGRDTQMSDINITPLVDVMLVLLVIFMIAMPALSHRLPFDLPQDGKANDSKPLQLIIGAGDVYSLDGVAMSRADVGRQLARRVATGQPTVLQIQASPEAEYESVALGVATARNAGVVSVLLVDH